MGAVAGVWLCRGGAKASPGHLRYSVSRPVGLGRNPAILGRVPDPPIAQAAMRGTNAAVVGILGAALYHPVWTSAILTPPDFALALLGFLLLTVWSVPPWVVGVLLAGGSVGIAAA